MMLPGCSRGLIGFFQVALLAEDFFRVFFAEDGENLRVAGGAGAGEEGAFVAEEKTVVVAGVGMAARDGNLEAFVELEFLRSDFIIFAGYFAGEDFVGN